MGGFAVPIVGGTGLEVTGALGTSVVELIATTSVGGQAGPFGITGQGTVFTPPGGVVRNLPFGMHELSTTSPKRSGESCSVTLTADAGDVMFALFTPDPGLFMALGNAIGPLVLPASAALIPFGPMPASPAVPTLTIPFTAPTILSAFRTFYLQPIAIGSTPGPHVSLGTPTVVQVLESGF